MDVEKALEGLSQEERLALLERLIREAIEQGEETLSTEERIARLERIVLGRWRGLGLRSARQWEPWGARSAAGPYPCCCC